MKREMTILFLFLCSSMFFWMDLNNMPNYVIPENAEVSTMASTGPHDAATNDADLSAKVTEMQKLLREQDSTAFADALSELAEVEKAYGIDDLTMEKQVIHNKRLRYLTDLLITITILLIVFLVYAKILEKRTKRANSIAQKALQISNAENTKKARLQFEISQSIRTPLNNIIGMVDIICQKSNLSPHEKDKYGEIISNNCHQLLTYIQNVLELSRIEVGKTKYKSEPLDIVKTVSEEIVKYNSEPGNSISTIITSPISEAITLTDRDHLLANLHSIFYSPIVLEKEQYHTHVAMSSKERGNTSFLHITIANVPLAYKHIDDNNTSIRNTINAHLFISCGGSYDVDYTSHSIEIMVPLTNAK